MTDLWTPLKNPEDKITIAKQRTPGICDIEGLGAPFDWEERGGYALSGATVVFRGKKLAHFSIKFRLYTDADWQDWYAFKPLVTRLPIGKDALGLDIKCKLTEMLGIKSIVVEQVMAPMQTGDGEWTIELKVIEYRAPVFTLSKPDGSKENEKEDPGDKRIEALRIYRQNKINAMTRPNNGRQRGLPAPP